MDDATEPVDRSGPKFVFGVLLIASGLWSLLERMHIIGAFDFGHWWPVILIGIGLAKFTGADQDRESGWFFLGLGTWCLLVTATPLSFGDTWPVLLILWGLSTIFGTPETRGRHARRAAWRASRVAERAGRLAMRAGRVGAAAGGAPRPASAAGSADASSSGPSKDDEGPHVS